MSVEVNESEQTFHFVLFFRFLIKERLLTFFQYCKLKFEGV